MKQYTKKELREFVRLGLAVDLTEAEPEKIPASYTKKTILQTLKQS